MAVVSVSAKCTQSDPSQQRDTCNQDDREAHSSTERLGAVFSCGKLHRIIQRPHGMDTKEIADEEDAGMEELESIPQATTETWLQRRMSQNIHDQMEKLCLFPYEFCPAQQVVRRNEVV